MWRDSAQLFFVALTAMAVILATMRQVTPSSAAVVGIGVVVAMLGIDRSSALVAVGMSVLWLGSVLLNRGNPPAFPCPLTSGFHGEFRRA